MSDKNPLAFSTATELAEYQQWLEKIRHPLFSLEQVPVKYRTIELCEQRIPYEITGENFAFVPDEYKTEQMCSAWVTQAGLALKYVPQSLRTEALCVMAGQSNLSALSHIPPAICTRRLTQKILAGVQEYEMRELTHVFHLDPDFCAQAVLVNGLTLAAIPDRDITAQICHDAVTQNGMAIEFVPAQFLNATLCHIAMRQNHRAIEVVPHEYIDDTICRHYFALRQAWLLPAKMFTPALCELAIDEYGISLEEIPFACRSEALCLQAVHKSVNNIYAIPARMFSNTFCRKLLNIHADVLSKLPEGFQSRWVV